MNRDPVRWIIVPGFSILLGLMSLLAYYAHTQIEASSDKLVDQIEITRLKTADAHKMRDIVRTRGNTIAAMYMTADAADRRELGTGLNAFETEFEAARDRLNDNLSHARERYIMNAFLMHARESRALDEVAVNIMLTAASDAEIRAAISTATETRDQLLGVIDDLIEFQSIKSGHALSDSDTFHKNTNAIILYLAMAALCIAALIAIQVVRHASKKNEDIKFQASHDALTRLVNRMEFKRRLQNILDRNDNQQHALCYLDLDQFKIINDTCGHEAGDELLIQITELIQHHIRNRDILARLGGDEFGLLLENCNIDKALEICEGIVTVVRKHEYRWKKRTYHVGVSIGLIPISEKERNLEKLMSEADLACYAAKDMGRNRVHLHSSDGVKVRKMQQELDWVADISNTILDNRFELHAQPIIPCKGKDDYPMYEVLLRLRNNQGSIISPGNYIPAAERFNLMREVDDWVARYAIEFLARKHEQGDCDLRLFVNLSANSISETAFIYHTMELLQQYKIPPNTLCFEITESSAIQNIDQAVEIMEALKSYGVQFALDDFGKGMSSFGYLKNLPVDYLKLDGDLVKNIDTSDIDRAMVSAINEIGRVMKIETIAEHVESSTIHRLVKQVGIDYAQGFHICKPSLLESINTDWPARNVYHL